MVVLGYEIVGRAEVTWTSTQDIELRLGLRGELQSQIYDCRNSL